MIYLTADTHFGHTNIIRYCDRPFLSAAQMDRELIERWNSRITNDDVVYHLGDFAFGDEHFVDDIIDQLNFAHLHVVKGNHERPFAQWYRNVRPLNVSFYNPYFETKLEGRDFTLCHYAMATWNRKHHGSMHLCGHSHYNLPATRKDGVALGKVLDVGVDGNNFYPYSLDEVLEIMDKKPTNTKLPELLDYHT